MRVSFKTLPISSLNPAPWNYKESDSDTMNKLKANIEKNGIIENLVVRELGSNSFEVINGNHRLELLKDLGIDKVFCCNVGEITLHKAKLLALELNETRFPKDNKKFSELMGSLCEKVGVTELSETLAMSAKQIKKFETEKELIDEEYEEKEVFDLDESSGFSTEQKEDKDEFTLKLYGSPDTISELKELLEEFSKLTDKHKKVKSNDSSLFFQAVLSLKARMSAD